MFLPYVAHEERYECVEFDNLKVVKKYQLSIYISNFAPRDR